MSDNVVRFRDVEKRSREPDGVPCRDPAEAEIINLPVVPRDQAMRKPPIVILALPENEFPEQGQQ